ncbi:sperm-specific sodium proton exchanger [Apostichopus japonicus]|uniref:Sperm-specific sodium proton exchanger n=1 Tax=Stichopus japonicus TaxID=307972 RepID=A0A2G8JCS5_STIJA|nr:sperm-specific sodium proton exchanger [Apostichopus japonicus]
MVEIKMKRLQNAPASIPPPRPEELLKNVAWLSGDQRLINFIKARAELLHYDYNEIIIQEGDQPNAALQGYDVRIWWSDDEVHSRPRDVAFKGCEDSHIKKRPMPLKELANTWTMRSTDAPSPPTPKTFFEDYLSVGNVIGEMGVLTGRPRNATVSCETTVMVYYINLDDMQIALDTFTLEPSLESRLWHVVAIRVATPLLLQQISYQGWTQEKVKLHLEKGYLPSLSGKDKSFDIDYTMEDVILIQGMAINAHTRDEIHSPCVIPRTVHRLLFPGDHPLEPRLLVVSSLEAKANTLDDNLSSASLSVLSRMSLTARKSHFSSMSIEIKKPSHNLLDNLKA